MKQFFVVLLIMAAAGISSAQSDKPELSLSIRLFQQGATVHAGSPIEIVITKVNLSNHVLHVGGLNRAASYTFDVRRDGVLQPETKEGKKLKERHEGGAEA